MGRVRTAVVGLAGLGLVGCVSDAPPVRDYVGHTLPDIVAEIGQPDQQVDLPNHTRAFRWTVEQGYLTPRTRAALGIPQEEALPPPDPRTGAQTGPGALRSSCIYTLYGRWNGWTWRMVGYEKPTPGCR